ncbi:hypothetical protein AMECASPLE_036635 [Ameca splendens]|uniref:Uncharacterized protein n=1 Tax=Ameca splendens TaxID=208324 RepID=A0ABV0Z5Y5_9TELE
MLLVLPISAAQGEQGFSAQNRIKNSTRSSLHVSTTEDLIRMSTEGCSLEEFDPSQYTVVMGFCDGQMSREELLKLEVCRLLLI